MDWKPSPLATHVETVFDPQDAGPGSLLIEHFNDPYEAVLDDDGDLALYAAAHGYLRNLSADAHLGSQLPRLVKDQWIPALDPAAAAGTVTPYFGWLPFEDHEGGHTFAGPRGSFRFRSASDHMAVLFASDRISPRHYTGSGFALALAMHIRKDAGSLKASFTGLAAGLPYAHFREHPISAAALSTFENVFRKRSLYRDEAVEAMARAANMARVVVRSIRIAASEQEWWIERRGVGVRTVAVGAEGGGGVDVPYAVTMLSVGGKAAPEATHTITHVSPLVTHAADPRVFDADPSSHGGRPVRPTRDEQARPPRRPVGLDESRRPASIFAVGKEQGPLQYPADAPIVKVMPCPRFVQSDDGLDAKRPRPVDLAGLNGPPIRNDDASAIQAFFHGRDLVQRIEAYGWTNPAAYFRLTAPEIKIFYRSGVSPGPGGDGRTVNARVIPEGWRREEMGMPPNAQRPALQIHLAAADLRRRERKVWTHGGPPAPAIPFGLAADRRWMWHEFGHVLLVASTGELEFRFAHSPGDAMAAIVADPDSKLPAKLRGATFPFVFLPRRHDRCAHHGWSWSGTLHAALAQVPEALHPRRKGYASEQILSSSLFRLYRCIGGDTHQRDAPATPDADERRRASHYVLYLIMQAMQLMGDARIQATSTPAMFVHWLRQADLQPGAWTAAFPPLVFRRVGGTLSKVIRWAFEAQGLYGSGDGPGSPEPVDIYIEDGRATKDDAMDDRTDYGPGSYVPVSLHWQARDDAAAGDAPRWQADPATGIIWRDGDGKVEVRVGNRGSTTANDVAVRLWYQEWLANTPPPSWRPGGAGWTPCQLTGDALQAIPSGPPSDAGSFTFDFAPGPGVYLLFAQATCADDRANTDPALSLACSYVDTPLVDLVANDNNLGLRVVAI
ncbi:MAG: hypothetical protein EOO30_07030 [Comamonadaceae bacterium]|nr:MAG: hypothetical protein EOO30_07030 [Comamonadaceae bacterium]